MNGRFRNGVVSAAVAASMITCGIPGVAVASESTASLQTRLQDAKARFEDLAMESARVGEALNDTYYQIDQTRKNIDTVTKQVEATQHELDGARDTLGKRIAANYRAGNRSLVDMFMGCATVEDFIGALYYADKVAEQDAQAIDAVETAQTQLEEQKSSLQNLEQEQVGLAAQQEQQAAELEESQQAQASYIKGLDSELRQQLEQERAAEIAAQQAAAARAMQSQQIQAPLVVQDAPAATQPTEGQPSTEGTAQQTNAASSEQTATPQESAPQEEAATQQQPATPAPVTEQPAQETPVAEEPAQTQTAPAAETSTETESSSSSSDDYRQAIIAAAYSQLGVPYVYGAESPGEALDCSGFTQYCYSAAGIDIPHSSVAQAGMADSCSIDDLQAGDLVFWEGTAGGSASGSHVAIYLGDGQIIHANGTEVAVGELSGSWTSCGSIS